jgi:queuine tRNA-ribosyltransferase
MFKIKFKDKKTDARIGEIKVNGKKIETPFFMPVATKASVKFINSELLKEMKAKAVISNALILSLKPGTKVIQKLGGLGKFMNFDFNVTDSGGFQMYSDTIYLGSDERGVKFRNPFSGEKILMTPERDVEIQYELGSDIAMCLDSMPLYQHSKKEIEEAVNKTLIWAERCKKRHDRLQVQSRALKTTDKKKEQLLFGISQGGIYKDLREKCILALKKMNFDGYSIGGFGLGESAEEELEIIKLQKKMIPDKPCYLMGIGNPAEIIEAIGLGVDMFDSRMPTQSARRGTIFTSSGKLKILNSKYKDDKEPLDKNCNCFVCKNYSRAYIRFQLMQEEAVGKLLSSYHNLYFLQDLIEKAKVSIRKGEFSDFKKKIVRAYK